MSRGTAFQLATYRLAARAVSALPLQGKIGESIAGRAAAEKGWLGLDRRGKVVWIHAASVGEAMAAEPVIRRLRIAQPDLHVVLTHSSPSVATWPHAFGATVVGFAPAERPAAVARFFDALKPDLLGFSRSDLWPELLLAARERSVPVAVFGATVRTGSLRLRWPVRSFLRHLYQHIRFVGAVSDDDADRWMSLGVAESAIVTTGDPRHDQVLERIADLGRARALAGWATSGPTLVAGSVEESDEDPLLSGLAAMVRIRGDARLLLVPHEPSSSVVRRLTERARRARVSLEVFRKSAAPQASCLVVLERGILPDLYALGPVSYVGGGFSRGGLHAVLEPAAYGVPVLIGPGYAASLDATRLVAAGGAVVLGRRAAAMNLQRYWQQWVENESDRNRAGLAARRTVCQGAASLTARWLVALVAR